MNKYFITCSIYILLTKLPNSFIQIINLHCRQQTFWERRGGIVQTSRMFSQINKKLQSKLSIIYSATFAADRQTELTALLLLNGLNKPREVHLHLKEQLLFVSNLEVCLQCDV